MFVLIKIIKLEETPLYKLICLFQHTVPVVLNPFVCTLCFFYFYGVYVLRWRCPCYFGKNKNFKDHYKADKCNPPDLHMKSPPEAAMIRKQLYLSLQRVQSPSSLSVMWFCSYNEGLKCGSGISSAQSPEPSSDSLLKIDMQTCIRPISTVLLFVYPPVLCFFLSSLPLLWSRTMFAGVLSGCQSVLSTQWLAQTSYLLSRNPRTSFLLCCISSLMPYYDTEVIRAF